MTADDKAAEPKVMVIAYLGDQAFGLDVHTVQDVLRKNTLARVPRAQSYIAGALNLRGRIVTAIDMRACLGLAPRAPEDDHMNVVIESGDELYSLIFDSVGDVIDIQPESIQAKPPTLSPEWAETAWGVTYHEDALIVLVDLPALLRRLKPAAAA